MTTEQLALFLIVYFLVAATAAICGAMSSRTLRNSAVDLALPLSGLIICVALASQVVVGENSVLKILATSAALSRTYVTIFLLAASMALVTHMLWLVEFRANFWSKALPRLSTLGVLLAGMLLLGKSLISPYLPHPGAVGASAGVERLVTEGFRIVEVKDTAIIPVRIAVNPNGRVFVSGHTGIAAQSGAVVELVNSEAGVEERLVAQMLNRPYGLLATEDALYVSRSGQYTRWNKGSAEHIHTGAVTRLTDLDGDGVMDFYDDIVTDLPGAQGPDYLHQNNAIAMSQSGDLYITTAHVSDSLPTKYEREGTILRALGPDYEQVEIFAKGLRNPFGLTFGAEQKLYATDNDPQFGPLGNLGDKFMLVSEGDHFGHPYAPDNAPGVTPPLLRSEYALGGVTFMQSDGSLAAEYDNTLYVVSYGEGRIMRVELTGSGESLAAEFIPFATVPGAVDIAAAPDGTIWVAVYPEKIMRIEQE